MKKEDVKNKDISLGNDKSKSEVMLENSGEIIELLNSTEDEVNKIADTEIQETEIIMERLTALGATESELKHLKKQLGKVDEEIKKEKESTLLKIIKDLSYWYEENIKNLDKAIFAEFKIRPISQKYSNFQERLYREKPYSSDSLNVGDFWKFGMSIKDKVEALSLDPEAVDEELKNDVEKDIKTYIENIPYRKFEHKLRGTSYFEYGHSTATDLGFLYAILLDKIKNNLDNTEKFTNMVNLYFSPSVVEHIDSNNYKVFNKKFANKYNSNYFYSILERAGVFKNIILDDKINLSPEQKKVLQNKVIEILEKEDDDISNNPHHINSFVEMINACDFPEDQKKLIHSHLFKKLITQKNRYGELNADYYLSNYDIKFSLNEKDINDLWKLIQNLDVPTKINFLKKDLLPIDKKKELINEITKNNPSQFFEDAPSAIKETEVYPLFTLMKESRKLELIDELKLSSFSQKLYETFLQNKHLYYLTLLHKSFEKYLLEEQRSFIKILSRLYSSPSKSLRNIAGEVAIQISNQREVLNESEIEEEIIKIENIFVKNNIPAVGKQYKVFNVLFPNKRFANSFSSISSPELLSQNNLNSRRLIIFKDLLKININSLNNDLKNYLQILENGSTVVQKYEQGEKLSEKETFELQNFLTRIRALADNIRTQNYNLNKISESDIDFEINELRRSFGVKQDEKIIDKFNRTFLKRIGISNIQEALEYYKTLQQKTDSRNRNQIKNNKVSLRDGDLLKVVKSQYMEDFLEVGVFSPEFIGAETSEAKNKSDRTPWDTDLLEYSDSLFSSNIFNAISGYGDLTFLVKDRGQFNKTKHNEKNKETKNNEMELFKTGVINEFNHMGIRTGFPSTEIDAVLVDSFYLKNNPEGFKKLKQQIAVKGFYIPICKKSGEVIFTPQEFDKLKPKDFDFSKFDSNAIEKLLSKENFNPKDLINSLRGVFDEEYKHDAGVGEGYSIEEHTLMVAFQYEKYFTDKVMPAGINKKFMRFLIALHDIGKSQAIDLGDKDLQHIYTSPIIKNTFEKIGFSTQDALLAKYLISEDPIGRYLKGGPLIESKNYIIEKSQELNMLPLELLDLFSIIYRCDAGSYTKDAGGKASLDHLFKFNKEDKTLNFSDEIQARFDRLRESILVA